MKKVKTEQKDIPEIVLDETPSTEDIFVEEVLEHVEEAKLEPITHKVSVRRLNMRSQPNKTSNIITVLDQNYLVDVLYKKDGWAAIMMTTPLGKIIYGFVIDTAITEV